MSHAALLLIWLLLTFSNSSSSTFPTSFVMLNTQTSQIALYQFFQFSRPSLQMLFPSPMIPFPSFLPSLLLSLPPFLLGIKMAAFILGFISYHLEEREKAYSSQDCLVKCFHISLVLSNVVIFKPIIVDKVEKVIDLS